MNKWLLMASTAAVAAGATVFVLKSDFNPFESAMTKSCESVLKERLRSPSDYKRVEITESQQPLTLDEYLKDHRVKTEDERVLYTQIYNLDAAGKDPPTMFTLYIKYDAPNAYGTPIRGISECQYASSSSSKSHASDFSVVVDNFTRHQWLVKQVLKAQTVDN
ncbi:hypothetical protein [Mesorhizobium sp. M8A.F.Ca.ET.165.01.1.1]|uniref:hypothetical protein n=1 Tax=Mesorhizobium sp. M8A.F.Ca.ET.165.01.1.1 TaxID=2563960 RepID=UPI00109389B3|nr:hypothetical protein [Mesorhizobium sp. M8A.F.Ca.ET.165.01.1.1]TGT42615.1 hypothetical protein EN808_12025 [Mesorhizobium sp. M8A.F.Ca.ET.165.01.1.1]